jgi:solute carrier family 25 citrate transporter 1
MQSSTTDLKPNPLKSIISGGIAGAIETTVTYPTEFVKTYMQLYKEWSHSGVRKTVAHVYNSQGPMGFYRGLSVLVYMSIPKTGSRFGAYQYSSNNIFTEQSWGKDSRMRLFLCGLIAGVTEAIVASTPMETVKTKLIQDRIAGTGKYHSLTDAIWKIGQNEGIGGLYRGLGPTIYKCGSNQAVRFMMYNDLKKIIGEWVPGTPGMMLSGALAGAISVYVNNPIDVVKTNMQGEGAGRFDGPVDCARQIWRSEGVRGFYKGSVPRLAHVVVDVAIVFVIYEHTLNAVN